MKTVSLYLFFFVTLFPKLNILGSDFRIKLFLDKHEMGSGYQETG